MGVPNAGRLSGNLVMTGNILLNGRKRRLDYGGVVSNSGKLQNKFFVLPSTCHPTKSKILIENLIDKIFFLKNF